MKAIETKFLGPTNYRGARIKATAEGVPSLTIDYPYERSGIDCHATAAVMLARQQNWHGRLIGGGLKNSYVFVFASDGGYEIDGGEIVFRS